MTTDEKRDILDNYCGSVICNECALNVGGWKKRCLWDRCLNISRSSDDDLDRALKLIGYTDEEKQKNPYWDRITAIANRQREKGITEYGQGIECDTADIMTRLDRIEEELIDALMYIEHLRDGIKDQEE